MPTLHPVIIRHYDVVLMPDAQTEYDPIPVTLSLSPGDADRIHPRSPEALREALDRAVVLERRTHHTPTGRTFLAGPITFKRARLVQSERAAFDRDKAVTKRRNRAVKRARDLGAHPSAIAKLS